MDVIVNILLVYLFVGIVFGGATMYMAHKHEVEAWRDSMIFPTILLWPWAMKMFFSTPKGE